MRTPKLAVLWVLITALFAGGGLLFGIWEEADRPIEQVILSCAMGVGTATFILLGHFILNKVRSGDFSKIWAAFLLFASTLASAILAILIIHAVALATESPDPVIFPYGDPRLQFVFADILMALVAGFTWIMSIAVLIWVKRK